LLTFISRRDVGNARSLTALREIRVPELSMLRKLGILRIRDRYLPAAAHQLLRIARDDAQALMAISEPQAATSDRARTAKRGARGGSQHT
jgi:hypothetical protein